MNNIMIFEDKQVEIFEWKGQILFNSRHVAKCLELSESGLRNHLSEMNENQAIILTNSDVLGKDFRKLNNRGEKFLTESGVYKLIFKSKKEEAEKFQEWVTDEVLPSIRKHGAYMTNETLEEALTSPDFLIKLATELKKEKEQRQALEKEQKKNAPKVLFADAVSGSNTSILIGDFAKILKQNGVKTGQNKLFSWLRENNYLIKRRGQSYNMPTQKSMDLGLFEIKENTITKSDGDTIITMTAKITGKGQTYFMNKFIKKM